MVIHRSCGVSVMPFVPTHYLCSLQLAWIKVLIWQSSVLFPLKSDLDFFEILKQKQICSATGFQNLGQRLTIFFCPPHIPSKLNGWNAYLNEKNNHLQFFRGLYHQCIDSILSFSKDLLQAQHESRPLITKVTKFSAKNCLLTLYN